MPLAESVTAISDAISFIIEGERMEVMREQGGGTTSIGTTEETGTEQGAMGGRTNPLEEGARDRETEPERDKDPVLGEELTEPSLNSGITVHSLLAGSYASNVANGEAQP